MITLGLTGSIGMGKSTTARLFAEAGARIYDADAVVHALYAPGGAAVAPIDAALPGVVYNGAIDRSKLAQVVLNNPPALQKLESIVHPLTQAAQAEFLAQAECDGVTVAVLDIPLLLETRLKDCFDAVVVVSAHPDIQRERVLSRPGMTLGKFEAILARQMPHADKCAHADFIVDTGRGLEEARAQVHLILDTVLHPDFKAQP